MFKLCILVATDEENLYWITDKAGLGKSTLMKFLLHGDECREHLKVWTGTLLLILAHFYF